MTVLTKGNAMSTSPDDPTAPPQGSGPVTQPNVEALGGDPAAWMGHLECAAVQAIAMALHNTVAADQQLDILAQAVLARKAALVMGGGAAPKPQTAGEDEGASGAGGG
jgi:hypothetical protein